MATEKRVLVVEDEEAVRALLRDFLEERGFEVTEAEDGYEGSLKAKAERFDLITVDLMMPQGSGTMVIEILRGLNIDTPVIVISGYASKDNSEAALKAGANRVMCKPVDLGELNQAIDELVAGD